MQISSQGGTTTNVTGKERKKGIKGNDAGDIVRSQIMQGLWAMLRMLRTVGFIPSMKGSHWKILRTEQTSYNLNCFLFLKIINLFLDRGEGRERGRETSV